MSVNLCGVFCIAVVLWVTCEEVTCVTGIEKECYTKFNLTQDGPRAFLNENPTINQMCAMRCLLQGEKLIDENDEVDINFVKKIFADPLPTKRGDEYKREIETGLDECYEQHQDAADGGKNCKVAYDFGICVLLTREKVQRKYFYNLTTEEELKTETK